MDLRNSIYLFSRQTPKEKLWNEKTFLDGIKYPYFHFDPIVEVFLRFGKEHMEACQKLVDERVFFWIRETRTKGLEETLPLLELLAPSERGFYEIDPKEGRRAARLHTKFPCYSFFHKWKIGDTLHVRRPKEKKIYEPGILVDIIRENTKPEELLQKYLPEELAEKEIKAKKLVQRPRYVAETSSGFVVIPDSPIYAANLRFRKA